MKRYKEIDIFRAVGIILVALYHFWVVSGYKTTGINQLNTFLSYGGEIGVTLFFIISGMSICVSLQKNEDYGEKITYVEFIKKRLKRIYPQYILCIIIVLLLGDSAVYLSSVHISSLLSHFFLVHNFSLTTHGSVSGVLWTIGVIFQFYLLAMYLYKFIRKNWKVTLCVAVLITILSKYFLYNYFDLNGLNQNYYFIYGRQIITALDNFVIGMCLGRIILNVKKTGGLLGFITSLIGIVIWIVYITPKYTVYSNSAMGYAWHTISAILLSLCIFFSFKINWKESKVMDAILFIGKNEYGIYLWHLLIANNLIAKSEFIQKILNYGYWGFAIIMLLISVFVGWLSCNLHIRGEKNE
ncbi:MAG: acyltransferase [Lachnospiraceae bacterium]|nr:acyltransferase [Lachnospiraceae bacterium]